MKHKWTVSQEYSTSSFFYWKSVTVHTGIYVTHSNVIFPDKYNVSQSNISRRIGRQFIEFAGEYAVESLFVEATQK